MDSSSVLRNFVSGFGNLKLLGGFPFRNDRAQIPKHIDSFTGHRPPKVHSAQLLLCIYLSSIGMTISKRMSPMNKIKLVCSNVAMNMALVLMSGCGSSPNAEVQFYAPDQQSPPVHTGDQCPEECSKKIELEPTQENTITLKLSEFRMRVYEGMVHFSNPSVISQNTLKTKKFLKVVIENPDAHLFKQVSSSIESYATQPDIRFRDRDLALAMTVTHEEAGLTVLFETKELLKAMEITENDTDMTECEDLVHKLTIVLSDPTGTDHSPATQRIVVDFDSFVIDET